MTSPSIAVAAIAVLLLGTAASTFADAFEQAPISGNRGAEGTGRADGPAPATSPDLVNPITRRGEDIHSAWTTLPGGAGPREGGTAVYDNGAPLDDYGDPASQLSLGSGVWRFIAAAADDFEIVDIETPDTNCQITMVRAAFAFFGDGHGSATPTATWDGIYVTVYTNSVDNGPYGVPYIDGTQSACVASVLVGKDDLLNETLVGECRLCYLIDIPVDIVLAKNTKYWLSLVPKHIAPPQSAWCISEEPDLGIPSHRGFEYHSIPFWTELDPGNINYCPDSPPAGTNKELSFALFGQEVPLNRGACCDESTGVCVDVMDPADCIDDYKVFHAGALCEFLDPPCDAPVTGACCNDAEPPPTNCNDDVNIADCPVGTHRFAPGVLCADLDPVCGITVPGACCLPGQACQDLNPTDCSTASGVWHEDLCESLDCPPDNDPCKQAILLPGDGLFPFNNLGATTDGPDDSPGGDCTNVHQDVWFRYVATCTGSLTVSLCFETDYDDAIAIYEGCSCPGALGPQVGCDDDGCGTTGEQSEVTVPVVAGTCYLIRIGGDDVATGSGYIAVGCVPQDAGACCLPDGDCLITFEADCTALAGVFWVDQICSPLVCPPPKDLCEDAETVSDGIHFFDTHGAETDGPGDCPVNQDVWFDYTATCTGGLTVSLCFGTGYDTMLAVYGDCDCPADPGDRLACDDDGCGEAQGPSETVVPVTEGNCYKIRVGGAGTASGEGYLSIGCVLPGEGACCFPDGECQQMDEADCTDAGGAFTDVGEPCLPQTCAPPNDNCEDAEEISDGSHDFDATGATTGGPPLELPECHDLLQDVWFKYAATCEGTFVANLCLVDYSDPSIAVYAGWDCPPTLLAGCQSDDCQFPDGHMCEVRLQVEPGDEYLIRVGGVYYATTGTLVVGCVPAGSGACCHEDYSCEILLESECVAEGDVFTLDEPCSPITCPQPEPPECCPGDANDDNLLNGADIGPFVELLLADPPPEIGTLPFCWADVNEDQVIDMSDITPFVQNLLDGATCGEVPTGACCFDDGVCQEMSSTQCAYAGGAYEGTGTDCVPNPCPQPPGACCFEDGSCLVLASSACGSFGGVYQGTGTDCDPNPCPQPPPVCCVGDVNGDGFITESDVAPFVAALLDPPDGGTIDFCRADIDENLAINGLDIEPFVQLLLTGATCGVENDECEDAEHLSGLNVSIAYDTDYATTAPGAPTTNCGSIVQDIWYSYLVPCTGNVVIRTEGSSYDTFLAAYGPGTSGCPDPNLCPVADNTDVACNDDITGEFTWSQIAVAANLADCLLIRVGGKDVGFGVSGGSGLLSIDCVPDGEGACCHLDYTCDELQLEADCTGIGDVFWPGDVCSDVTCPPIPVNDDCEGAIEIACGGQVTADNTWATTIASDPEFSCHFGGSAQGVGTVWFKFTAAGTDAMLSTCNSVGPANDTLVAVYDAASCLFLSAEDEIACNEDAGGSCGRLSEVCVVGLTEGNEYYIQVASFDEDTRGEITLDLICPCPASACCLAGGECQVLPVAECEAASGTYQGVGVGCDPNPCGGAPTNDECASAKAIACNGEATVDNTLATTNPSDPAFSCHYPTPAQGVGTVWYTFVATDTAALISTCKSQPPVSDTLLAVYDGSCGALTEIACSEDDCGRLSEVCASGLTAGNTYYVQVASYFAGSQGVITLNVTCPCP
ncbi:MAG: hypothetical protein JXQ75_21715 [Phycisphaerae bacterium]|nr:hypothetical protein [Phycisphaerae bacterium]